MFPARRNSAGRVRPSPPLQSAEEIAGNQDLLTEILLRLPIKSVLRFKSVSKQWLSLISDHRFPLLHRSLNPSSRTSGLILYLGRSGYDFVNLDLTFSNSTKPPFKTLGIPVVHSCNGLLLCCTHKTLKRRQIFVYNPTTNRFSSNLPPISGDFSGLALAFDPSKSPHYKVICVMLCQSRFAIYSSESDEWREFDTPPDVKTMDIEFDKGVYCNGSMHWLSVWQTSLRFSFDNEAFSNFPMPPTPDHTHHSSFVPNYIYFGESRGHLHLVDGLYDLHSPRFDIHEMKSDYSQWIVKFSVDIFRIPSSFPQIVRGHEFHRPNSHDYEFSVLCIVRGNYAGSGGSYLVLQIQGKVLRYNLRTKTFFKLCDVESSSRGDAVSRQLVMWYDVHQFVESLALV